MVLLAASALGLVPAVGAGALPRAAPIAAEPKAWIVVDAGTGRVIAGKDVHTAYSPASMSKIMTALTAVERLAPTASVKVTAEAIAHSGSNRNPSGMALGQHWSLDQTLAILMIISANDAAYSLATTTSGSLAAFARAETRTAERLGLHDSTFSDPAGLDDGTSFGGGPRMSAFDVAISVRNALQVPQIARWAATFNYSYTDPAGGQHSVQNHNWLIAPGDSRAYPGATGFKTGFTNLAGQCLAATATRNGHTMIAVVMSTWDTYGWASQLLDRGFAATASTPGTGEKLPEVKVSTYAQRASDRAQFLALVGGSSNGSTSATGLGSVTTFHTTTTTSHTGSKSGTHSQSSSSSDSNLLRNTIIVLVLLGAAVVVLRRRAVRRQRARRLAKRRQMQAALRRGSLPVVDGRYRRGMRTGPPMQSNVKIRRYDD